MADKQPLVYPHMPPPERAAFCARAPWWTAPVIVGGSGGSGTRGSVLLLQRLGVGMACEDAIFDTSLFDPTTHCNRAKDFDLMGGRRQRMPQLVWFTASQNHSEPHQPSCSVNGGEVGSLLNDLEAKPSEKGFSMERLTTLRAAIRPAYRQPLRWGMKNPHSTYILGLLLRYFPCLAYVHTLRNLPEMVRNMDHIVGRIDEAATYGYLHATMASRLGVNLNMSGHGLVSQPTRVEVTTASSIGIRQVWLAGYLIRVNGGLAAWGRRCLPAHQLVYLATMKLARCPSDSCTAFAARDLSHVLRLAPNVTRGVVAAFARASHAVAMTSHEQSIAKPLLIPPPERSTLLRWPALLRAMSGEESCPCSSQEPPGPVQTRI